MAGCADDLRNRTLFDCGAGDAVISYSIADVILTRDSEEEDFESKIDHAYLLFYASDASVRTGEPLACARAENDPGSTCRLKFKMPNALKPNTDYQLLAIANADTYTPKGFDNFGDYIESWSNNYSSTESSPLHLFYNSRINPENVKTLPMSGEVKDGSVFRFSMNEDAYQISSSLSFRRKVARVDVANIVKEGFKVEGIMLCNWRDAVDVYPSDDNVTNTLVKIQSVLSEGNVIDSDFIPMPATDENGIQQLNKKIYCFPSVSNDSYIGDKKSTALIIKAKYRQDSESSYYRVNVGTNDKGNVSEVKPNTKYLITIQSVKGSGAPTPQEAYSAKESPIVLSVVEDWDLDGSNFAMDDKGNFIVVSSSKIYFEGNDIENREVKVLTSKDLNWSVTYVPDNEDSKDAFRLSNLFDSSFTVCPVDENTESITFSGKCVVSAPTSDGKSLTVAIPVTQQFMEKKPYEPEIPDMDFTIIPVNGERVQIDHKNRKIEIDAFDPECFNSFIDIPFKAYIKPGSSIKQLTVQSSDLSWPLEGAISKSSMKDYFYCANSFASTKGKVFSGSKGIEMQASNVILSNVITGVKDGDEFFISVGAMAPDDPAIERSITIMDLDYNMVNYNLIIKPSPVVIDDVILSDNQGNKWLLFDRNIQDLSSFEDYVGLKNGRKYQAYDYTNIVISSFGSKIGIPFKYSDSQSSQMFENKHTLYRGVLFSMDEKENLQSTDEDQRSSFIYNWLLNYQYMDSQTGTSPFYDDTIFEKWQFPTDQVLRLCASKMRVSKMRMFLLSEVPVKDGKNKIPICCYWPFQGANNASMNLSDNSTYGYFTADESGELKKIVCLYCDDTKIGIIESNEAKAAGMSRLVRQLTDDEFNNYKQNYLGYGSQPHKLTLCHPDTYTSEGWIPY